MTYPPQGPYGEQQGGHGEPSGSFGQQQPPSDGFPQQPGYQPQGGYQQQQGEYDPYGQQQGFGQQGQPGGSGQFGQPPKKNNKAIIAAIAGIVAVLLIAFLITGFWAPGFLVSSDDEAAPPAPSSTAPNVPPQNSVPPSTSGGESPPPIDPGTQSAPPSTPDTGGSESTATARPESIAKVMDHYLAAVKKGDKSAAKKFACILNDPKHDIADKLKAKRVTTPTVLVKASKSYKANISGTKAGKSIDASISAITASQDEDTGKPCVDFVIAV